MEIINKLTPNIKGKAFDADWFLLRQRFETVDSVLDINVALNKRLDELKIALSESLKLQAHYGMLLNQHDGGMRMIFTDTEAWLERLRAVGKL